MVSLTASELNFSATWESGIYCIGAHIERCEIRWPNIVGFELLITEQ